MEMTELHEGPAAGFDLWKEELRRDQDEPDRLPPPAQDYLTPAGIHAHFDRMIEREGGRPARIGLSREGHPIWAIHFGPAT
jgi:hypothetical protein